MTEETPSPTLTEKHLNYLRTALRENLGLAKDAPDEDIIDQSGQQQEWLDNYETCMKAIAEAAGVRLNGSELQWSDATHEVVKALTALRQTEGRQTEAQEKPNYGKRWTEVLCTKCGGNGVVAIHHGTSVCPRCDGRCYEPESAPEGPQGTAQPAQPSEWLKVIHAIAVEAMTAQSDPNAEAVTYRKSLIGICNMALKAQDVLAGTAQPETAGLPKQWRDQADNLDEFPCGLSYAHAIRLTLRSCADKLEAALSAGGDERKETK